MCDEVQFFRPNQTKVWNTFCITPESQQKLQTQKSIPSYYC